jgi:hypothetical protein
MHVMLCCISLPDVDGVLREVPEKWTFVFLRELLDQLSDYELHEISSFNCIININNSQRKVKWLA